MGIGKEDEPVKSGRTRDQKGSIDRVVCSYKPGACIEK